jgi:hypothetical protein
MEEAAVVVQLAVGEVEIVNQSVEGLHPAQHSRLYFKIFIQVSESLTGCQSSSKIWFCRSDSAGNPSAGRDTNRRLAYGLLGRGFPTSDDTRNRQVSFFCHKRGHLQRKRFLWRKKQGKAPEQSDSTQLCLHGNKR